MNRWLAALTVLWGLSALWSAGSALHLKLRLHRLQKEKVGAAKPMRNLSADNSEAEVSRAAQRSGGRLTGMALSQSGSARHISLDWEGSQAALVRFLADLEGQGLAGPAQRIHIRPLASGRVSLSGVFEISSRPPMVVSTMAVSIPNRDVFKTVASPVPTVAAAPAEKKPSAAQLKKEQVEAARLEEARRAQQEKDRLEAKRRDLESGFVLTGIVNNGRELLAFVQSRGGANSTFTLRRGDPLDEARVAGIDETRGELKLDLAGLAPIVLRLNP